jgi:hypothetical protein
MHLFKVQRSRGRSGRTGAGRDQEPSCRNWLRQAKLKDQYDTYVADLRKKAHIEYR